MIDVIVIDVVVVVVVVDLLLDKNLQTKGMLQPRGYQPFFAHVLLNKKNSNFVYP
jgi:hypothetical protein